MTNKKATKGTIKSVTENFRKLNKQEKQMVEVFVLGLIAAKANTK